MTLKIHNTLTKSEEAFLPLDDDKVTLYTCGPTVYNFATVGNWVPYVYWDTLVRVLLAQGYSVERTMNITDVGHLVSDADDGEDKLEKGARREGKSAWEIAEFYAEDFVRGMEKLGLIPPEHFVRATDMIEEQLALVRTLKEKGYTYQTTDGIYFDTAKFSTYADFARLDLAAQMAGARVEQNTEKRQSWDFALWKFTPIGQKRDMEWTTPKDLFDLPQNDDEDIMGFPGWHLECSAIAMTTLGETIDIHTGGIDHIPVHHTNEIAQSEAATGQQFSRYWLHNNHLKIDGTKVSKSLGNTYTIQDLEEKGYNALELRLFILQSHYQSEGNFTFENLDAVRNRLKNWRDHAALRHQIHDRLNDDTEKNDDDSKYKSFHAASGALLEILEQNLATPDALKLVDDVFSSIDDRPLDSLHQQSYKDFLTTVDDLLGLQLLASTPDIDDDAKRLILERQRARDNKDWKRSDELRDELIKHGIVVRDTPSGPVWSLAD